MKNSSLIGFVHVSFFMLAVLAFLCISSGMVAGECYTSANGICSDVAINSGDTPFTTENCDSLSSSSCQTGCCCLGSGSTVFGKDNFVNQACTSYMGISFFTTAQVRASGESCDAYCKGNPSTTTYFVRGIIRDTEGNPVSGATVTLVPQSGASQTMYSLSDGTYAFSGIPSKTTVYVRASKKDDSLTCQGELSITVTNSNIDNANIILIDCCREWVCEEPVPCTYYSDGLHTGYYTYRICNPVDCGDNNIEDISSYTEWSECTSLLPCSLHTEWTECSGGSQTAIYSLTPVGCDPNNPSSQSIPASPETRSCTVVTPPSLPVCGDSLLNGVEECDPSVSYTSVPYIFKQSLYEDVTSNCRVCVDYENAKSRNSGTNPDDGNPFYTAEYKHCCNPGTCECLSLNNADSCTSYPGFPERIPESKGSSLMQVIGSRDFILKWIMSRDDCADLIDHFNIYVCENDITLDDVTETNPAPVTCTKEYMPIPDTNDPSIIRSFSSDDIYDSENDFYSFQYLSSHPLEVKPNYQYCFKITAIFEPQPDGVISSQTEQSFEICAFSGDEECFGADPRSWCGSSADATLDVKFRCDYDKENSFVPNMLTSTACGSNEYCTFTSEGTSCLKASTYCESCNSIFGFFGYQGYVLPVTGSRDHEVYCPSIIDPSPGESYETDAGNEIFSGCYMDYSRTAVDKTYSCLGVNSCYDYKSRGACENDYCQKFVTYSEPSNPSDPPIINYNCEWEYYDNEFNKGVCRPKDIEKQNCNLCGDPAYNRIYPDCTKDTCKLYGYCYFKESASGIPADPKCRDGKTLKCSDYDNELDCTGDYPFEVNVAWNDETEDKFGHDNEIIALSHDYLGIYSKYDDNVLVDDMSIGRCRWFTDNNNHESCVRDADYSYTIHDRTRYVDDCVNGFSGASEQLLRNLCERDTIAPTTVINSRQSYGLVMDFNGDLFINDNIEWGQGYPASDSKHQLSWLYYCVVPEGRICYPHNAMYIGASTINADKLYKVFLDDQDGIQGVLEEGYSTTVTDNWFSCSVSKYYGAVPLTTTFTISSEESGVTGYVVGYGDGAPTIINAVNGIGTSSHTYTASDKYSPSVTVLPSNTQISCPEIYVGVQPPSLPPSEIIPDPTHGSKYTMFYFSEDPAKNLETVKSFSFLLDTSTPVVGVEYITTTFDSGLPESNPDKWKSDVRFTITLNSEDESMPVTCNLNLETEDGLGTSTDEYENYNIPHMYSDPPYDELLESQGDTLVTTYPALSSGHYHYVVVCTDDSGNTYTVAEKDITLDNNYLISNPQPTTKIYTTKSNCDGSTFIPGTMSINTGVSVGVTGGCRYSSIEKEYNSMRGADSGFFNKDSLSGKIHTASINNNDADGVHKFYVACSMFIDGSYKTISGDDSDTILYYVDSSAPQTTLIKKPTSASELITPYIYDANDVVDNLDLVLSCKDKQYPDGQMGTEGCKETYYCVVKATDYDPSHFNNNDRCSIANINNYDLYSKYDEPLKCTPGVTAENIDFDYSSEENNPCKTEYGNSPYVCYYSVDNACNAEPIKCMRINVRNTLINKPQFGWKKKAVCQNNLLEDGEECDDGNNNNDDSCKNDCTWQCNTDSDCSGKCMQCDLATHLCTNQPSGSDLKNECTDVYTCGGSSEQDIMNSGVCDDSGACSTVPVSISTCSGDCDSYCVAGQSSCYNTENGADPYNICPDVEGDCLTDLCGEDAACAYTPVGQNDGYDGTDGKPDGECDESGNFNRY